MLARIGWDMGSQVSCHIVRWGTWDEEEYSRAHSLLDTRGRGADRRQSPWILSYADKRDEFLHITAAACADSLLVLPHPLTRQVVLSGLQTVSGSGMQMGATVLLM